MHLSYLLGQGIYINMDKNIKRILDKLPTHMRMSIEDLPKNILNDLEEIRIRCGRNTILLSGGTEVNLNDKEYITSKTVDELLNIMLDYSYYAHEDELSKGYVTIEGGHRVGICGKVILNNKKVALIKDVSSLNIRRSKEVIGAANGIINSVYDKTTDQICNTLIISPPKCGKTTIIRDLARLLSLEGYKVGICDERSEIAGSYNGESSFDLGPRTDVLDGCPKSQGMIMLVRSMSPDVIITDEIGKEEDVYAVKEALHTGVKIITTIHGNSYDEIASSDVGDLIKDKVFDLLIFLSSYPKTGTITRIMKLDESRKGFQNV